MTKKAVELQKGADILPCPFCGEKEEIYIDSYNANDGVRYRIFCANCMCMIDRGWDQQYGELLELWNKRTV